MYESYYGLTAKPFQLRPDPHFFFGSKGHKRAMAYLDYGLSQGEGFIVVTGEVGAGKTTLMRNLLRKLESDKIVAAQIVTTHVDSDDILRMVAGAFGLTQSGSKSELLTRLEQFLRHCDQQGKRALLVVDEAQNLSPRVVEELRMLSNFQTADKSLLQTFLLGQPEFRKTLLDPSMEQLRQRVIATYHLGPMDASETRAYIEHRLHTVDWRNNPSFNDDAFDAIHTYTSGIPRKINSFCDRLFLMGYLEEIHTFGKAEVITVIGDIQQEFELPLGVSSDLPRSNTAPAAASGIPEPVAEASQDTVIQHIDARMSRMERSVISVADAMKKMLSSPRFKNPPEEKS